MGDGDSDGGSIGGETFGGEGDFGGMGPAGPGPAEGSETGESDYGGGFGFGDSSGLSGADSALANLLSQADFSDFSDPSNFGFDAPNLSLGLESMFSVSPEQSLLDSLWGKLGLPKGVQQALAMIAKANPLTNQVHTMAGIKGGKGMAQTGLAAMAGLASPLAGFAMTMANKGGLTDSITAPFGQTVGLQGGSPADGGPGGGMLEGLGGMYSAYKGMKDSGNMLGSLQSLYSQDSPYAQAMRQQLQRRDAAGGRRSQYGPREVELQAKLAQMASSQIPAMNQLQQRQNINRAMMLQQGLGAFNKMGGLRGLQDFFGIVSPQMQDWGSGLMQDLSNIYTTDTGQGLYDMPNFNVPIPDLGADWG